MYPNTPTRDCPHLIRLTKGAYSLSGVRLRLFHFFKGTRVSILSLVWSILFCPKLSKLYRRDPGVSYVFLLCTYLVYSDIPEHRSLTAAVTLLAHIPEFVTALELSTEIKRESASDLEHCIAQVKYVTLFYQRIF